MVAVLASEPADSVTVSPSGRIPTASELATWKTDYAKRYARDMVPGYEAIAASSGSFRGNYDELEPIAAPSEKQMVIAEANHMEIALARGNGFDAGRSGREQATCPHVEHTDLYFAWHTGWQSGAGDRAWAIRTGRLV